MPGAVASVSSAKASVRWAGTNTSRATMFLLPGPASPMGCQLSSITQSALRSRKNPRRGGAAGLGMQPAEELPRRVAAAPAKPPDAGEPIAAVNRHRLADRRIGPGGERAAVLPDFVLRCFREAGDEPLVRGEQTVNPAGRAASARNGGNDLREHVEAVL